MTNKEAIYILKPTVDIYKTMSKDDIAGKEFVDAFEMAITALTTMEKIKEIINSDLGDKYAYDEIVELVEKGEE